jgi:hypothetical protein
MLKFLGNRLDLIESLSNLRTKALRKKVWFSTLTVQERTLVSLITRNMKIVKNSMLATVIARIIVKLIPAVNHAFWDKIEKLGSPVAKAAAEGACAIGWKEAAKWVDDINIVRWYGLSVLRV